MLAYEVYELNNGSLYLVCYKDGRPVFIGGGYESRPGAVVNDIEHFLKFRDTTFWEGNLLYKHKGMYDELSSDETNLICGNGELFPENMGANGKKEFLEGEEVGFRLTYSRAVKGTLEQISEWWYGFPYDCDDDTIDGSSVSVGGFSITADTVAHLADMLGI